ncbi:outer membrane protein assembly factor BamA [Methylomarinum vadi]|uniref:outer membrane protein assembly factor BamA n=1 Tax=Methylomarinum vadi TaxID=438855 RepID=UPI0004DF5A21|nr:outer membrane protein assembly factor BamA [Methylomarinum vadi]
MLAAMAVPALKAADGFVVEDIQVRGLQRISAGTVFNYLPVNIGENFTSDKAGPSIRALFQTGFFKDISLEREGNTLVVNVVERPSIAKIIFEGNKDLSTEDLKKALDSIGLSEGKVFNRLVLEKVEQELRRQYFSHGKYGLKIETSVTNLTRNRVGIHIKISEGRVAKIKQINIVGNKVFDKQDLIDEFELSTTNWLSFYTKDDQYSKQKLSADLERLRSYYLDRGYINFAIESTQVAITPDKKEIYITINVKEGDLYTLEKVKVTGNLIVPPEELISLVQVGPGEIFSRKNATQTSKAISDRLGDEGYVFANVNMVPEIDEEQKTVDMTFFVDPGKRVYVRRINMRGNTKTRDEVLRREMRQMESSWASTAKIERSKTRLERLGYFEEVNVETPPVVGTADQIDVNYSVVEKSSGNLSAGVGFSQTQGIVFNANVSQDNVFGSGKRVNLAFNNSSIITQYSFGYFDPYFTLDGVSMGYDIGYSARDANQANISNYSTDVINTGFNFGIPLNEYDRLRFNIDLKHTKLNTSSYSSNEIVDFVQNEGEKFLTLATSVGWTHDTLNRAIFPSEGGQQRLSALATIPGSDLEYYKIAYKHQQYFPLSKDFTFRLLGELAYGDGYGKTGSLPFFEHYYAGGVQSVRGYNQNTLGPRDSNNRPFGGSSKIVGKAELFFPVPFMEESKSIRLGSFFDAGTVSDSFKIDNMRYSVGLSGEWLSPFGALAVSFAVPLNSDSQDDTQAFQFSFGSGF